VSDIFVELLEEMELEPYSYSGRGMFGKSCVGVTVTNTTKFIFELGLKIGSKHEEENYEELKEGFENIRTDNMGLDYVVYFPDIDWI